MNNKFRLFTWANIIVVALFVSLIIAQANKKFALDEVDFPVLAKAISETGSPYHYRGETDPSSLGLWHPPLYAYSLAAFVKAFGFNENTVRAFGMCCTLLCAYLSILIYRKLFKAGDSECDGIIPIFLSLFLLHPYTIANSTVPDIDSTVLPIAILIFLYGLVRVSGPRDTAAWPASARNHWPTKDTIILSLLFALNLWAKMTTPLILIPVTVLIFVVKGWPFGKSLAAATAVGVFGCAVFLVTYWVYCFLLNLPFDFTFRFLVFSFTKNSSSGVGAPAFLSTVIDHLSFTKQFVNWLGIPFVFALALSCSTLMFEKTRSESDKILIVFAAFGLFVTAFYLGLTGAFGGFFKYPYPIFPILVLIVAHYAHRHLFLDSLDSDSSLNENDRDPMVIRIGHNILWPISFFTIALATLYYQFFVAKDIVILENRPVAWTLIFSVVGIAAAIGVFSAKTRRSVLIMYGLSVLLPIMICTELGISRSQAAAVYPTKYHYGQIGFDETVSYLKERLASNEPIWAMKDIGHYANGVYIENYSSISKPASEITPVLQDVIRNRGVRYLVVTKGIGQDRVDYWSGLRSALDDCCSVDREFGNFVIYKARQ